MTEVYKVNVGKRPGYPLTERVGTANQKFNLNLTETEAGDTGFKTVMTYSQTFSSIAEVEKAREYFELGLQSTQTGALYSLG